MGVKDDLASHVSLCRKLARDYRVASEVRGRWMALAEREPADHDARTRRFEAGMREDAAWRLLFAATGRLVVEGRPELAAEIRQSALRQATLLGLRAMRTALREVAA